MTLKSMGEARERELHARHFAQAAGSTYGYLDDRRDALVFSVTAGSLVRRQGPADRRVSLWPHVQARSKTVYFCAGMGDS
jgi:hypothetical protein